MDYELMMNGNVKIGQKAPDFEVNTTQGIIKLDDYKGKWLVLFSYPGDFMPICMTEIIAFSYGYTYFQKMNTEILGLSIDSNAVHEAWINEIKNETGIEVPFPLIADRSGMVARSYGMISQDISKTEAIRNVFIIDTKGIVRVILSYPLNLGRFIPEIIRIVEALQISEITKEAMPANWTSSKSFEKI